MRKTFVARECHCFLRGSGNEVKYLADVVHWLGIALKNQVCAFPPDLPLGNGFAYEFPLTITVNAHYSGPYVKYEAEASANGEILEDEMVSIPVLKSVSKVLEEEKQCEQEACQCIT